MTGGRSSVSHQAIEHDLRERLASCDVAGCPEAAAFTLNRTLWGDRGPKVVLLAYCPTHYGLSNRFHDRRAL